MAHPKTVEIYGPIGEGENTPEAISRKLKALGLRPGDRADLRVNSPGGDCFMGFAIYNVLRDSGVKWTVYIDGVAASMGSLIAALLGAHVVIAENAFIMIHDPAGWTNGSSKDMHRSAKLLDSIRDTMAKTYAARTGHPVETIVRMMNEETWLNADEAVAMGFADEKGSGLKIAAGYNLAPFGYRHVPPIKPAANMADLSAQYWAARGEPAALTADDDTSDLVPKQMTSDEAFAKFHGKYAGRR